MTDGDKLLAAALKEIEDLDRQLVRLDRRIPVDFFADKGLLERIRTHLAIHTEEK